ncbi:MAG: PRD domain-containing protein [Lachnospiraceae bacterium]
MKIIKKIKNNVAIALDGRGKELIVFGKGIGFPKIPYELTDLSKVERTFYDIEPQYYGLLQELPEDIIRVASKMVLRIKNQVAKNLNPNLVFILADHINFAVERARKGLDISLPYSYELEYEQPGITKLAAFFVKNIGKRYQVFLPKGEITSITMHILNAMEGTSGKLEEKESSGVIIRKVTEIIEEHFDIQIDKESFNYFRFKNHMKYFVDRKSRKEEFTDQNQELYDSMRKSYPETYACVLKINEYITEIFHERCSSEEMLYFIIHVNRLYMKEGLLP